EVDALRASAGSWPETSTIVIISQAATNSATEPEMTRRRILRARTARSLRSAWPRARAASLESVICRVPRSRCGGRSEACDQLRPTAYQPRRRGLRGLYEGAAGEVEGAATEVVAGHRYQ